MNVTIIGTGNTGSAFAFELKKAGYMINALAGHNLSAAKRIGRLNGCKTVTRTVEQKSVDGADIILISVKDGDIKSAAVELKNLSLQENTVIVHTSGVLTSEILAKTGVRKSNLASFHPIQTIPFISYKNNNLLSGIYFGIEGGIRALSVLKQAAAGLRSKYIVIRGKAKPEYHLSCVLASNFIFSNFYLMGLLSGPLGITEKKLFESQMPLVQNTRKNIMKHGVVKSITGPVSRGDLETLRLHIDVLHGKYPDFIEYYKSVSGVLLKAAVKKNKKLDTKKIIKLLGE
ncbi:MAG: DUF2520 domain-containing protein [Bacteroidetes bacterium]|nr:DUF2520 domain-containing protein [Bacteroidota bacterium]